MKLNHRLDNTSQPNDDKVVCEFCKGSYKKRRLTRHQLCCRDNQNKK